MGAALCPAASPPIRGVYQHCRLLPISAALRWAMITMYVVISVHGTRSTRGSAIAMPLLPSHPSVHKVDLG